MTIVSNQVHCRLCGDNPFSSHRHDFRGCKCGAVFVDGGNDYLRRVTKKEGGYVEKSIQLPTVLVDALIKAVEWSQDTGRNERGTVYAVLRTLRDGGVKVDVAV
jgi:hypothetical protein